MVSLRACNYVLPDFKRAECPDKNEEHNAALLRTTEGVETEIARLEWLLTTLFLVGNHIVPSIYVFHVQSLSTFLCTEHGIMMHSMGFPPMSRRGRYGSYVS